MGNYPKTLNAFDLNEWFNSENEDPIIIDVREDSELEIACFPRKFVHLPISKVSIEYVKTKFSDFEATFAKFWWNIAKFSRKIAKF